MDDIIALFKYKNSIELMYVNCYKKHCYLIQADFMIYYKEQVFIIIIEINMQYSICYILQKNEN